MQRWRKLLFTLAALAELVLAVMWCLAPSPEDPKAYSSLIALGLAALFIGMAIRESASPTTAFVKVVAGTLALLLVAAIVFPILASGKAPGRSICMSNVKQLKLGLLMYQSDNDDYLPPADRWRSFTEPLVRDGFNMRCDKGVGPFTYGMNSALSGIASGSIASAESTSLVFDTDSAYLNTNGGVNALVFRHNGLAVLGLADGHAKAYRPNDASLRWNPR